MFKESFCKCRRHLFVVINERSLYIGFKEWRGPGEGFICVGLNICVRRENKEGTDHIQYLVRIYVYL